MGNKAIYRIKIRKIKNYKIGNIEKRIIGNGLIIVKYNFI
jgi:hypothetical protein